jgi:hypothetical protein
MGGFATLGNLRKGSCEPAETFIHPLLSRKYFSAEGQRLFEQYNLKYPFFRVPTLILRESNAKASA